jgi:hypothetical protein
VAARKHILSVSVPGLRALRWSSDGSSAPGSLRIQEPGDVVRDLARDGLVTYQIVAFPARAVEGVSGKATIHAHLAAGDTRGAAFHRLHDAVQAGAGRLALEVAIARSARRSAYRRMPTSPGCGSCARKSCSPPA